MAFTDSSRDPHRPRPVVKALHRPLTICGVDRRLFFLALMVGAAAFNLFDSARGVRAPRLVRAGHGGAA